MDVEFHMSHVSLQTFHVVLKMPLIYSKGGLMIQDASLIVKYVTQKSNQIYMVLSPHSAIGLDDQLSIEEDGFAP